MNCWKLNQRMPPLSSFATISNVDTCHPRRFKQWLRGASYPDALATCPIPNCQACFYGENTKKSWRSKTSDDEREAHHPVTQLGECVSVNMMTLLTQGLIAQMSGKPTCKRYCHAVVYINQATGLGFVWLQKSVDLGDTMEGKIAFKKFCQEHGIAIQHYHADNGIFTSNTWRQSCLQQ